MKKYIFIFLIPVFMFSCALSKIKRADRNIERAMVLDPSRFERDTIYLVDSVYIENHTIEKVTEFVHSDTVTVINNERVRLQYVYDTITREIWHEVECKGDTVYIDREVYIDKVVKRGHQKVNRFLIILVCVSLGLFMLRFMIDYFVALGDRKK